MIVLGLEVNLLTLLAERRRPAPVWRDVRRRRRLVAAGRARRRGGAARARRVALQLLVTAGVLVALVVNLRASARAGAGARRTRAPVGAAGRRARVGRAEHVDEHGRPAASCCC